MAYVKATPTEFLPLHWISPDATLSANICQNRSCPKPPSVDAVVERLALRCPSGRIADEHRVCHGTRPTVAKLLCELQQLP